MSRDADVIVVGAGPAGATAARGLALGGARVRLLDRSRFPRNKPCGGGVTMRTVGRFPYLQQALGQISTHYISRLHLEGPAGDSVTLSCEGPGVLMVRRLEFDHLLVRLAVEAGVDLVEKVTVSQVSQDEGSVALQAKDGRVFRAPFVIAADGVHSVIARRLGLNPGWAASSLALDLMEETPSDTLRCADPNTLWVWYGPDASDGYGYVFPKRDHVNVGIGYLVSYYRSARDGSPYELQQRFVARLRDRGVVEGASSRRHFTPYLVPVGGPLPRTGLGRVLLAGDAGGFVNAYTAEGIYYAMVSGELAAGAILRGNQSGLPALRPRQPSRKTGPAAAPSAANGSVSARYQSAWRREIGSELRDSVLIQKYLFQHASRINGVVWGARNYPAVAAMIVGYATGTVPYLEARRRLLLRFPRVLFRLARIYAQNLK